MLPVDLSVSTVGSTQSKKHGEGCLGDRPKFAYDAEEVGRGNVRRSVERCGVASQSCDHLCMSACQRTISFS